METVHGIGIDIVNIARIEKAIHRWGERFLRRTFTPAEIAYCAAKTVPWQHYSGRFAAKEAVFKALGTGWSRGIGWLDVEICVDPESGQPTAHLSDTCLHVLGCPDSVRVLITMSHDKEYAIAQAMILTHHASV
jgi:holo-[acyl-carrier protein] synthase